MKNVWHGHRIAYCGGWTIAPEVRIDEKLSAAIRELVTATHSDYFDRFGVQEALILGIIKFKAHLYQEFLGYKRMVIDNQLIDALPLAFLNREPAYMLHLTEQSAAARQCVEKYRSVLDAAKVFSKEISSDYKKAA